MIDEKKCGLCIYNRICKAESLKDCELKDRMNRESYSDRIKRMRMKDLPSVEVGNTIERI